MKLYAIKDILIDYFLQPFAAPDDPSVLAAIARSVNSGEISDLAQAPHHFQIWQIAEIDKDGHVTPRRELLAECSSLIREGIRESRKPGSQPTPSATGTKRREPTRNGEYYRTQQRLAEDQVETEVSPPAEIRPGAGKLD